MYLLLFLTLYVFRAHRAHHQERQIVSTQPLVTVTLCRWPCRVQVGSLIWSFTKKHNTMHGQQNVKKKKKHSVFGVMTANISCFSHAQYISQSSHVQTKLQMIHSVMEYTELTKPFFLTFKSLTVSQYTRIWFKIRPQKLGLLWADFHETHQYSTELQIILLYRISPTSGNKYGKHGQIHYAPKKIAFTAPIFVEFTIIQ
jgi:hypothetical protein